MRYVQLGDRQVSAIGLGTWQFGSIEWGWGRDLGSAEALRIVRRALDLGITLFDTAEVYGSGRSELLLGEALRGIGDDVFVATKVWPTHFTEGSVVAAAGASLQRLGRMAIDLYQIHFPNPVVPLAWSVGGLRQVLDRGLARSAGVSNFSLRRWQRAERLLGSPLVSNQVRYHLLDRSAERALLPYAARSCRTVMAYSPLGQGLLGRDRAPAFRLQDVRIANRLYWPENRRRSRPMLAAVDRVARERGATPAQIALAWATRDPHVVAIPGARRVAQIEENAAAGDMILTAEELQILDNASRAFRAAGWLHSAVSLLRK